VRIFLVKPNQAALAVFRTYMVEPGQMLCFNGDTLLEHRDSLQQLTAQGLLTKDEFKDGYSLTRAGFAAMQECQAK
jgi:hypothetical protein